MENLEIYAQLGKVYAETMKLVEVILENGGDLEQFSAIGQGLGQIKETVDEFIEEN